MSSRRTIGLIGIIGVALIVLAWLRQPASPMPGERYSRGMNAAWLGIE